MFLCLHVLEIMCKDVRFLSLFLLTCCLLAAPGLNKEYSTSAPIKSRNNRKYTVLPSPPAV